MAWGCEKSLLCVVPLSQIRCNSVTSFETSLRCMDVVRRTQWCFKNMQELQCVPRSETPDTSTRTGGIDCQVR